MPPRSLLLTLCLFLPACAASTGTGPDEAWRAILAAGGRPVGPALGSWSWEAHGERPGLVGRLERQGALVAFRTTPLGIPLAGCLGIPKTPEQRPGFTPGL